MKPVAPTALASRAAELRSEAEALAAGLAPLRALTTPGIERAALRFLGINGLDPRGEPLAAALVDRFHDAGLTHLGEGIALALALAAAGRGTGPQETALAAAGGEIDLATEAAFLQHPERRAVAEALLGTWRDDAFARIDANRTARHELDDTLGMPDEPWRMARLGAFRVDEAVEEAHRLLTVGADGLLVRIPRGRELVAGVGEGLEERLPADLDPAPAGSQRGIAALRTSLDELAAERGTTLLLASATEGLAAPEQAVVAAFERVDVVFADPFDEMALGVEPQRAFADHAAAHRLLVRSGTMLALGPGPLLAGPELRRGESLAADVRIGRSIAAQAVAVAWATGSGVASERLILQAPFELAATPPDPTALAAELLVRRTLHPECAIALVEPADASPAAWRVALPLAVLVASARLVVPAATAEGFAQAADATGAAALLGDALRSILPLGEADGPLVSDDVTAMAVAFADAALATIRTARSEGWDGLLGSDVLAGQGAGRYGRAGILPAGGSGAPWLLAAEEGA
jgi:hypothetical protein